MKRILVVLAVLALAGWLAACKMTCAQAQQAVQLARMVGADAVAEAIKALTDTFPDGSCPVPEPPPPAPPVTTPPVTEPPAPPPTTLPPTPAPLCLPDQGTWVAGPSQVGVYVAQVQAALDTQRKEHPEQFVDGGARLSNQSGAGIDALYDALGLVVARSGLCGGQIRNDGARGDKFGMLRPDGAVEVYHIVEYGGFRIQAPVKVNSVWVRPEGTPTPTPGSAACPVPRWETYRVPTDAASCTYQWGQMKVGRIWIDSTLQVKRCCGFCAAIGLGTAPDGHTQRCDCPLRNEGQYAEHVACDAEVGQLWQARNGTLIPNPENAALANCSGAGCQVRVCTKSGVCSEWAP